MFKLRRLPLTDNFIFGFAAASILILAVSGVAQGKSFEKLSTYFGAPYENGENVGRAYTALGSCYWLKRTGQNTGDLIWWERYYSCETNSYRY